MQKMRIVSRKWMYLPHALSLLILFLLASSLDLYWTAQAAQEEKLDLASQFAQCLSGQWRGKTEDGTQIACMPAETITPKEKRK